MLANLDPTLYHRLVWRNLLAHKGGGWDLLAGTSLASYIKEGAPVDCCAHHAGIGVCASPLQHSGRGPVVESQLPGAVATHPNSHSPHKHSHTRHGLLSWRRHRHIMIGLGLKEEEMTLG